MKIAHKMMISFLLTAIVCSSIGAIIVFYSEKDNLKTMVDEHLSTTVQSRGDHIETVIEGYRDTISALAEKKAFIKFKRGFAGFIIDHSCQYSGGRKGH